VIRPVTAASTTLAVFDDTLPVRSRFLALLSSLSINLFLPFVNGVMLGFGEIFAKTVIVGWFGWGPAVATNVGLGQGGQSRSKWWGR
jgi:Outer membrane protein TOM13